MPFHFLTYLQPTHYFRLFTKSRGSAFPKVELLSENMLNVLSSDTNYSSQMASDYDLSWQAVQAGYLESIDTYSHFETLSVRDNYHFIRKYFHPAWVFYVLIIRLATFHNPFKELRAWIVTAPIKRVDGLEKQFDHSNWLHFNSELLAQQPMVSVVIPTLNRYDYLKDVLHDFEQQDYSNFEVIIVDQSDHFNFQFYQTFNLKINVIHQKEKALWLARNTAIKASKGELIGLSEDDVRIQPDWISTHIKCLDFFDAKVSAGVFYPEGESIPDNRSFFSLASQFATGNAMIYKSVFITVGLFDRQFEKQRMGDGEFGLRVYLEGFRSVSNPYASCVDLKAGTGGLREMGSWDAFRPSNFLAARPIPSVLYYFRKYYGDRAAARALWKTIPLSIMPYKFKKNRSLMVIGIFLSLLLTPLVLFQVFKSWRLASIKLKEGARVGVLEVNN